MSTMSYASIWNETLQKIQESNYFDSHTFNSWISKTTLFKIEDNIAYVAYRSTITFSILKKQKEKDLFHSIRFLWCKDTPFYTTARRTISEKGRKR